MSLHLWQFWIDVGGTFTDCFGRQADGRLVRHKLLSSGAIKGAVGQSTRRQIVDPSRATDPEGFWLGYTLRLLDEAGQTICQGVVTRFDKASGSFEFDQPLSNDVRTGQSYELSSGEEAPVVAIRYLLGLTLHENIPPVAVRLGTTAGHQCAHHSPGAKTALVTTRYFGDILEIGYQNRPRLFDLAVRKRQPLFSAVVEIDERLAADGRVLVAPDPSVVHRQLTQLKEQGIQSLAICLLHSTANNAHEQLVADIARQVGFADVSVSSQVAPLEKIVSRGDTTVVDAYLNPVLRRYTGSLGAVLPRSELRILTSAGSLVSSDQFLGKDSILSGPAGGVVGFSRVAQAAGFERAIGFDMGGTSTDVSRFDGRYELEFETEKSQVRLVAPMMAIETVAAGGGSICGFDGVKLVVGPDSMAPTRGQPAMAVAGR